MPRKTPSTIEIGTPGLKQYSGRVDEEWHLLLKGPKAAKTYEEMRDNDPTIGAVFYAIESFLRGLKWGAKGPDEAEEDFLRSCMHDMDGTWDEMISDALSMLVYGFSLHEVIYKIRDGNQTNPRYSSVSDDGRYGWRAISLRSQTSIDRWDIEPEHGQILGAYQQPPNTAGLSQERYLPMNRCVLFRTRTYKNNPEGRSILRTAFRPWRMKKRLEEIEAIGVSRDLNGLPIITVPASVMRGRNATASEQQIRADMERLVSSIHRDEVEGMVFPSETLPDGKPSGYKIMLLTTNGSKQVPADPIIRRYDARIAMSMAAEFLLLGTEKQGSFALGAEKSANFLRSLSWYVEVIAETLNKTAVKRLYDVNDVPVEKRAKIVVESLEQPSAAELGAFLQQMISAGAVHITPKDEAHLRELASMPEISEEDLQQLFEEEKQKAEEEAQLQADALRAKTEQSQQPKEQKPNGRPQAGKGKK